MRKISAPPTITLSRPFHAILGHNGGECFWHGVSHSSTIMAAGKRDVEKEIKRAGSRIKQEQPLELKARDMGMERNASCEIVARA